MASVFKALPAELVLKGIFASAIAIALLIIAIRVTGSLRAVRHKRSGGEGRGATKRDPGLAFLR